LQILSTTITTYLENNGDVKDPSTAGNIMALGISVR
jgi:hypothetical protein